MKLVAILFLSISAFFLACKTMEDTQPMALDVLSSKHTVRVPGNASRELAVTLLSLTDTRCPQNVICVQAGKVDLSILVNDEADSIVVESVFRGNGEKNKPVGFVLSGHAYNLYVERVLPLPLEGKKPNFEDYSVGFRINNR